MKNKQGKHFQSNSKKTTIEASPYPKGEQYPQNNADWQAQLSPSQKVASAGRAASNDRARQASAGQGQNNYKMQVYQSNNPQGQVNTSAEENAYHHLADRGSDGGGTAQWNKERPQSKQLESLGQNEGGSKPRAGVNQGSPQGPVVRQPELVQTAQPSNKKASGQKQELNLRAALMNERQFQTNSKSTGRQPNKMNHIQLINPDKAQTRNGSNLRPVVTGGQFRKGKSFKKQLVGPQQYGFQPQQATAQQQRNERLQGGHPSSRQQMQLQASQTSLQSLSNLNARDYSTEVVASNGAYLKTSYKESTQQALNFQQYQQARQSAEQSQQRSASKSGPREAQTQRASGGKTKSNEQRQAAQPVLSNSNKMTSSKIVDVQAAQYRTANNNSYENDRRDNGLDGIDTLREKLQDDIQVLSKKLISFRSQSKEEDAAGLVHEVSERRDLSNQQLRTLGSARVDQGSNPGANVNRNQFSTLCAAAETQRQSSGIDSKSFNRSQPIHKMPNINGAQDSGRQANESNTNQLSPARQGNEHRVEDAANSARMPATHQSGNGGKPSRGGKMPRLISGHPQRRLPQQKNGPGSHQQTGQQSGSNGRSGPGKPALGAQTQGAPHALQGFTRRRQPQGLDGSDETNGHNHNLTQSLRTNMTSSKRNAHMTNSLQSSQQRTGGLQVIQGQNQASQQALQTIPMATLDALSLNSQNNREAQGSREALNANTGTNSSSRFPLAKPKVQKGTSLQNFNPGATTEGGSSGSFPLNNVIYHPHPLNNNLPNASGMAVNQLLSSTQATFDPRESARPHSQKQNQAALNNRNSRKNLKPLGKKPPQTGALNAAGAHKAIKGQNPPGQHTRNQANSAKQSNALAASLNLQLIQAEMSVSTSRERALALGGVNFATNSSSQRAKNPGGPHQDSYQSQSTSNQGANIANMNALFKFKKNTQGSRGQQQQASLATGAVTDSNSQNTATSGSRRPIIVRKNNYLTQQQQPLAGTQMSLEQQSASAQNLRGNGTHPLQHQNRQQAMLQQHLANNQQQKFSQVQAKNQQQLKQSMQHQAQQASSSHKASQPTLPSAMAANQSQDGRKYFKINSQGREAGLNGAVSQQPISQFKPSQTVAFGGGSGPGAAGGLGELAGLTGLMACSTGSDNHGGEGSQISQGKELSANAVLTGEVKNFQAPLLRHNNSNDALQSSTSYSLQPQQVQTARQSNKGTKFKESTQKIELKQTTMLGNLTSNFKNLQAQNQSKLLLQSSDQTFQSASQSNLQLSTSNNNKLIKVNKSKKILETARRSRIQQLDKDNYNTQGNTGVNQLNLVSLNSNGAPPQYLGAAHHLISSATNKTTKGKKLNSLNVQNANFKNSLQTNNSQRQQQIQMQPKKQVGMIQQQFGASSQSSIQQVTLDNTYLNQTKQLQQSNNQSNKVQLNMNFKMNGNQLTAETLQGIKQAHSQKHNQGMKLNVLSASNPRTLAQQQNQNTLSYTQQPNLEAVLGSLQGTIPLTQNSNEKQKQASTQSQQILQNSIQSETAGQSYRIPSSARNGTQLPSGQEQQTNNTQMTFKEVTSTAMENSDNHEIGISSDQIVAKDQPGQKQQPLAVHNEHGPPHANEYSADGDVKRETIGSQPRASGQVELRHVELQMQKAEHRKESVNDVGKLKQDQLVLQQAEAKAGAPAQCEGEADPKITNAHQERAQNAENFKSNVNQTELNDIVEEDGVQELEAEAAEEAGEAPMMECAKNEYELNQTAQKALVQKTVAQSKKVLQVQNKITDQRTTMDTNSNRKQTTDSQQRTNFNTSMQNIPRGIINTAFSLTSAVSRDEVPPLPTTPQNILKYYIHELTDYEKGEILDYDTIYFLGKSRDKKADGMQLNQHGEKSQQEPNTEGSANQNHQSSKSSSQQKDGKETTKDQFTHNYGYDDDKGDYKIVMGDHIGYRYEIVEFLGKGSFGTALRCVDHKDKRELAVKIVKNKKKYYYQASVELKILQYLRQHDQEDIMNVIHIEDYVVFRKHLCMAFELLSMNLFEFLKINDFNGFDHNLIRRFAIQLLYALKYLKQLEIIHCDLKPENILLKEENKSGIKIIDFGSSTFVDEKVYTYIQSRFYRAPEIMLGIPYTPAIDMWSLGCIMAELYIGYPLFPGESENDQMSRIMEMRDAPPPEVLKVSERKMKFFMANQETHSLDPIMLKNSRGKLRKPNGKPLDYVIGDEDPDFNDFVTKCLDWNPSTRITPDEALKHVWVLKGLPPQVLIHHQKMHNIATPELPESVKFTRDEFLMEQQREELRQQQKRVGRAQKPAGHDNQGQPRDISHNPNVPRPHVQLKTPRSAFKTNTTNAQAHMIQSTANLNKSSENNLNAFNIHDSSASSSAHKANQVGANNYPGTARTLPGGDAGPHNASKMIPQTLQQSKKANFNQTLGALPRAGPGEMSHNKQPKQLLRTDGSAGTILPQDRLGGQPGPAATRRKFLVKKATKNEGMQ